MSKLFLAATIIECIGIAVIGVAIGFEAATSADIWYIAITTGSCVIASGSLLAAKVVRR